MQEIIVAIILLLSVGYAVYRVYKSIRQAGDPCYGCKGCALHEQMKKNECYKRKATTKQAKRP